MKTDIVYISFTRFPAEKAHALYLANICDAFAALGMSVALWVPRRFEVMKVDPFDFYGVANFLTVRLWCIDLLPLPIGKRWWHKLGVGTFTLAVVFRMLFAHRSTLYFTNDVFVAFVASYISRKVVFEIHDYPQKNSWLYRVVVHRVYRVLTNNEQKVERLVDDFQVTTEKIIAVHNGVSVHTFKSALSKPEARDAVDFDMDKKYVVYTGHLYDWKGAHVLAEAASYIPDVMVVFVGGTVADVSAMSAAYAQLPNVLFLGYQPHDRIPDYLKAADVLVVPNSGKFDVSRYHTSPMKLFEYMTSKRPIVASDLPSIREIVDEKSAILVRPDHPSDLAAGIQTALMSNQKINRMTQTAYTRVQMHSWLERAKRIMDALT